jgi:adenylate cyclase
MESGPKRVERRLAAIFAADVAGYSRLMGQDEVGTLRALTAHREVMDRLIGDHGGRIANTAGDSVLAEFPSAVDAVHCAVEVQGILADLNKSREKKQPLYFRIGVHIGDVMVQGGDLLGDGVNIAARLQALADPGGVCVSGEVHRHVRKISSLTFKDLGEQEVKNIDEPVRAFVAMPMPVDPSGQAPALPGSNRRAPPDRPTIAVLPFANLGGDPGQDYFADGMVDEIITGLAHIHWLTVIARNSSFTFKGRTSDVRQIARDLGVRYVLEGSIRKAGDRIRLSSQLVEAETGGHLWANRFDGFLADVFDLQDQITEGVVFALEPTLRKAEIARAKRKRPDDLDAYDLYLRAVAHMYETTPQGREAALAFVERALAIDPNYAEAHGVAAWCYLAKTLWEGGLSNDHRESALRHARAVQALQSEDATTLAHTAIALALATRDLEAAIELIDRALALNPNSVHAHDHGAVISTWAGRYERAHALADRALRLSPFDPLSVMAFAAKAGAFLMQGHYNEALSSARKGLQIYPNHTPSFLIAIASLMRLGKVAEAQGKAQEYMNVYPEYRILKRWPVLEHFCDDLRGAGLPE